MIKKTASFLFEVSCSQRRRDTFLHQISAGTAPSSTPPPARPPQQPQTRGTQSHSAVRCQACDQTLTMTTNMGGAAKRQLWPADLRCWLQDTSKRILADLLIFVVPPPSCFPGFTRGWADDWSNQAPRIKKSGWLKLLAGFTRKKASTRRVIDK